MATAPAVSVAAINFSAATAAAGATIAIMGATLACVASGATTTQFNAGSGATLATNLAAAINAATSSPTVATGNVSALYLKGLVWASASAGVLTVYTRIASAKLNSSFNAACAVVPGVTAWTSPPATTGFSGGVSGPWRYFFNNAPLTTAINASISAACTYGGVVATVMGAPAGGDIVHVRTGRAGTGIVVDLLAINTSMVCRAVGSAAAYLEYRFDEGTVWSDGASSSIFEIRQTSVSSLTIQSAGYSHWRGQIQSGAAMVRDGGVPNFRLSHTMTNNSGYGSTFRTAGAYGVANLVIECMEVYDSGAGTAASAGWAFVPNTIHDSGRPARFINCKFGVARPNQPVFFGSNSYGLVYDLDDCLFNYGTGFTYTRALVDAGSLPLGGHIRLLRPKFVGGNSGHHALVLMQATNTRDFTLAIDDPVSMGDFQPGDSSASLCGRVSGNASAVSGMGELAALQCIQSPSQFLLDTARRIVEWRAAGFPTTGISKLQDGATPYSLRFGTVPVGVGAGLVNRMCPQRCIKQQNRNTLGAGARTLTQHVLIDASYGGSAYTPTDADWWVEGTYLDATSGFVVPFTTRGAGTALAADTQAWSSLTYAPFAGASRNYSRWAFVAALANVAANSIVTSYVVCATQPSALAEWCLVDPLFELA